MSVGKEAIHVLESLQRSQVRIYDDACDIGIWETSMLTLDIRSAVKELAELEGMTVSRWHHGQSVKVRCGFEMDAGLVQGVQFTVTKNWCTRRRRHFYTISSKRDSWKPGTRLQ